MDKTTMTKCQIYSNFKNHPKSTGQVSVCGAKLTSRHFEGWWVSSHARNNWAIFNDHIGGVQTSPGSAQDLFGMPMVPVLYHLRCSCSCTQFMVKSMAASITYHLSDANSLRSLCEPVKISQRFTCEYIFVLNVIFVSIRSYPESESVILYSYTSGILFVAMKISGNLHVFF